MTSSSDRISAAQAKVNAASDKLLLLMEREFPDNCDVMVSHARGRFYGRVHGWDSDGIRLHVLNEYTNKYTWQYYVHVERLAP